MDTLDLLSLRFIRSDLVSLKLAASSRVPTNVYQEIGRGADLARIEATLSELDRLASRHSVTLSPVEQVEAAA